MATYEEQQKALRSTVPSGSPAALDLQKQGYTDVGTSTPTAGGTASFDPTKFLSTTTNPNQSPATSQDMLSTNLRATGDFNNPDTSKDTTNLRATGDFNNPDVSGDRNDLRATGYFNSLTGTQSAPTSKFEQGFKQANATLDSQPITSASQANSLVQQYAPQQKNDVASTFIKQDPNFESLVSTWQEYINPKNQRASLADTYKQMTKDSGLEQLDMEILDAKRVIEGTEDDLRSEITAAGGMATESQISALASARNKTLIKNYSNLIETRSAKEKYLQTMMQLEGQDREAADQRFDSMMNYGFQIADYGQKMKRNALESLDRTVQAIGWDGLYDTLGGNTYEMSLIEQAYGLPAGGLQAAAQQAQKAKLQAQQQFELERANELLGLQLKQQQIKTPAQLAQEAEERRLGLEGDKLGLDLKREQIKTEQAQRNKIYSDIQKSNAAGGGKPITSATALQIADSKAAIDMLDNLDSAIRSNSNLFGPFIGRFSILNPYNTKAQTVQATINSTKQIVGKYLEGGVLRKEDESKYEKILPKMSDTPIVASKKLNEVKRLVNSKINAQNTTLQGAGYNPGLTSDSNVITAPDGAQIEIID